MTNTIKLQGRLRSYGTANRQGTLLTFSVRVIDKLTDEIKGLLSKRLVLHVAEDLNGHAEPLQPALPLPVDEQPKPEPQLITIPGQPIGKPRQTQQDKWKVRPCVARYRQWADRARKAAAGKIPEDIEGVIIRAYFAMPNDWSVEKRLQMDGKKHHVKPDYDNVAKSVGDSLLDNDEILADAQISKRWTNGDGFTEVIFY